ncbi:radical SAM protein [Xanthomonas fragariae]|uniref:radical SAM protein n=1 Tax=Xanthomonas fragariae TaxID=48664 RepID=UPI0022AA042F|nr:radical SAM protein [Xanthomonas fragariae]WAT14862.1 radical SAM protein [Xanthomonas fragariae]
MQLDTLFVVLKLAERCNINCSYCYYYAPAYQDVYQRPPLIRPEVLQGAVEYLRQALEAHEIRALVIAFHGGEPTLLKAPLVDAFCRQLQAIVPAHVILKFAVQTNGVHFTQGWIELIQRHDIDVGISIDGLQAQHDRYRVDHRGRGTYERIASNIASLQKNLPHARRTLGTISVINPGANVLEVYRNISGSLGISRVKFLWADRTHDTAPPPAGTGSDTIESMLACFDHWLLNDQQRVSVELFDTTIRALMLEGSRATRARPQRPPSIGLAILSDGTVRIADEYMAADEWFKSQAALSLFTSHLSDWLQQPHVQQVLAAERTPPSACASCEFHGSCGGGDVASRYSARHGFDNLSVHCAELKALHRHVARRLKQGMQRCPPVLAEETTAP